MLRRSVWPKIEASPHQGGWRAITAATRHSLRSGIEVKSLVESRPVLCVGSVPLGADPGRAASGTLSNRGWAAECASLPALRMAPWPSRLSMLPDSHATRFSCAPTVSVPAQCDGRLHPAREGKDLVQVTSSPRSDGMARWVSCGPKTVTMVARRQGLTEPVGRYVL